MDAMFQISHSTKIENEDLGTTDTVLITYQRPAVPFQGSIEHLDLLFKKGRLVQINNCAYKIIDTMISLSENSVSIFTAILRTVIDPVVKISSAPFDATGWNEIKRVVKSSVRRYPRNKRGAKESRFNEGDEVHFNYIATILNGVVVKKNFLKGIYPHDVGYDIKVGEHIYKGITCENMWSGRYDPSDDKDDEE